MCARCSKCFRFSVRYEGWYLTTLLTLEVAQKGKDCGQLSFCYTQSSYKKVYLTSDIFSQQSGPEASASSFRNYNSPHENIGHYIHAHWHLQKTFKTPSNPNFIKLNQYFLSFTLRLFHCLLWLFLASQISLLETQVTLLLCVTHVHVETVTYVVRVLQSYTETLLVTIDFPFTWKCTDTCSWSESLTLKQKYNIMFCQAQTSLSQTYIMMRDGFRKIGEGGARKR